MGSKFDNKMVNQRPHSSGLVVAINIHDLQVKFGHSAVIQQPHQLTVFQRLSCGEHGGIENTHTADGGTNQQSHVIRAQDHWTVYDLSPACAVADQPIPRRARSCEYKSRQLANFSETVALAGIERSEEHTSEL